MKRRTFLAGATAWGLGLVSRPGQTADDLGYSAPPRFTRPETSGEEGGLWALMDREERNLRRSPLIVRDGDLQGYVQDIACRLGSDHCPDIRVTLVRTPLFNASMAPNGMMQVWTGLLLRVENEAQLAAVLGHEIGHYLQKHSVERLRDIKSKSAIGQVFGLFGLAGAVGQLAVAASAYAYGRQHETEADRIGAQLMHRAGYQVGEAAKIWSNLLAESQAAEGKGANGSLLFATHPAPPERRAMLENIARSLPDGVTGEEAFGRHVQRYLDEWLNDEIKRGQYAESLVLTTRHIARKFALETMHYHRGEIYRLRGRDGDLDLALGDYRNAIENDKPYPLALRGIGLIQRQRGQRKEAIEMLSRYLELAPAAPDALFIQSYIAELNS